MTYKLDSYSTNLKSDVFLISSSTGNTAGSRWNITKKSGKTYNTSVTINASNNLVLPAGSSYYMMASPIARQASKLGKVSFQLYDETNSQYIGNEAEINIGGRTNGTVLQGQKACRAFIQSGDITGSDIEVSLKVVSVTASGFTFAAGLFAYVGFPSLSVLEV